MPEYSKEPDKWESKAACLGYPQPEIFHPHARDAVMAKALAVCKRCPVTVECAQVGQDLMLSGIWGGKLRKANHE